MHTVVETRSFLTDCKAAGIDDDTRTAIITAVGLDPGVGDILVGGSGVRKFRYARPGQGKSGGFRVISFRSSDDLPVFLIAAFGKNQKDNLSAAELAAIARYARTLPASYSMRNAE